MEGVSTIFAEIAAGGSHVSDMYAELEHMGMSSEDIRTGVEEARASLGNSNGLQLAEHHGCGGVPQFFM